MLKAVIILTKADSIELAEDNVNEFMEQFQNDVYDYYTIGGRWENELKERESILPLSECIDKVKEWVRDMQEVTQEHFNKLIEFKESAPMQSAYYAGLYKDAVYENFCFKSNVYNSSTYESETIPEDIENYYAVIIDMHN